MIQFWSSGLCVDAEAEKGTIMLKLTASLLVAMTSLSLSINVVVCVAVQGRFL